MERQKSVKEVVPDGRDRCLCRRMWGKDIVKQKKYGG